MAKSTTIPTERIRAFALRKHPIPKGRARVVVGTETVIYGLARLFQICGDNVGEEFEVVHSLEEAYEMVGARPEGSTEQLFTETLAA